MEEWRDIEGWEGYQVSSEGRVRSVDRVVIRSNGRPHTIKSKILKQSKDSRGYLRCDRHHKIHRIVANAFVPNPNNYSVVHHKDGNKTNNRADNLVWIESDIHNKMHGGKNPCKKVYQYNSDNLLVNTYQSVQECGRENNLPYGSIAKCCRGEQKTYKGYKWSYLPL